MKFLKDDEVEFTTAKALNDKFNALMKLALDEGMTHFNGEAAYLHKKASVLIEVLSRTCSLTCQLGKAKNPAFKECYEAGCKAITATLDALEKEIPNAILHFKAESLVSVAERE